MACVGEWLELESDPGVFSLLVQDYGVRGVKVEEVYDLANKFRGRVYGFVFLFRWEGDRRSRKKALSSDDSYVVDSGLVSNIFFAHQIITNSCATHALLSVLLNCSDIELGPNLSRLKEFTLGHDPDSKGFAIANMLELARIHNKHARPSHHIIPPPGGRRGSVMSSAHALLPETYHFVSYVPINDRLFELDGLREFPIDHGPWGEHENWTDLFQRVISQRLGSGVDLLYNLMAVVPDNLSQLSSRLQQLQTEQKALLDTAMKLAEAKARMLTDGAERKDTEILSEVAKALPQDSAELLVAAATAGREGEGDSLLRAAVAAVLVNHQELEACRQQLREELETKQRYRIEFSRRTHNYDKFIAEFVKKLNHNGQLPARVVASKRPQKSDNHRRKTPKTKTTLLVNGSRVE